MTEHKPAAKKSAAKKTAAKKSAAKKTAAKKSPDAETAETTGSTKESGPAPDSAPITDSGPSDRAPDSAPVAVVGETSDLTKLAQECLNGKWRTGRDRDELLKNAGHDPEAVRKEVYRIRGEQLRDQR